MKTLIYIVEKSKMKTHSYYLELASSLKTLSQALNAAIKEGGLEEKAVYIQMKIDSGNWARMVNGKANFPAHRIKEFCEIVSNPILIYFINYQNGYEPRILPKNLDEKLKEKDRKIEEQDKKIAYLEELLLKRDSIPDNKFKASGTRA